MTRAPTSHPLALPIISVSLLLHAAAVADDDDATKVFRAIQVVVERPQTLSKDSGQTDLRATTRFGHDEHLAAMNPMTWGVWATVLWVATIVVVPRP